jgi:hypothetical protein
LPCSFCSGVGLDDAALLGVATAVLEDWVIVEELPYW